MEKFAPLKLELISGNTKQSAHIVIMKPQTWFIDKQEIIGTCLREQKKLNQVSSKEIGGNTALDVEITIKLIIFLYEL